MTIVLTNDGGDIQNNIRVHTSKYLSRTVSDLTLSSEVLDTLFERVELIPFLDLSGRYKEACGGGLAPFY